ncbi:S8 family serine peptidase [bacterium]|nr:S8 family serine peptidase [bacterium]
MQTTQYILLPRGSLVAAESHQKLLMTNLERRKGAGFAKILADNLAIADITEPDKNKLIEMEVVDSIQEQGAKLVCMTPLDAHTLRQHQPNVKLIPLVYYRLTWDRPEVHPPVVARAAAITTTQISVVSALDGTPIENVQVIAVIDFANRIGDSGFTDGTGNVTLRLSPTVFIERLYVIPKNKHWSFGAAGITLGSATEIRLKLLEFPPTDVISYYYGRPNDLAAGTGVRVGVIDTGVGPHQDIKVAGGENTVTGEDPDDYQDNGAFHGTHVAGIIAARGNQPNSVFGMAPGVELYSYRVFGAASEYASNFAIAKGIDRAVAAGCDVLNMSLGGGEVDEATTLAIEDARSRGTAVIVAAGNEEGDVSFPANLVQSVAVSAFGRLKTFPEDSTDQFNIGTPVGTDPSDFFAAFSNLGEEVDVTGPGVAILSTVPIDQYAVMSGTSMACPAITGFAAKALSARADIMQLPRDGNRSAAIVKLILDAAQSLGFGLLYEGKGLPR